MRGDQNLNLLGESVERRILALFWRVRESLDASLVIREMSSRLKDSLVSTGDIVSATILAAVLEANVSPMHTILSVDEP
jgi:aspartokinase